MIFCFFAPIISDLKSSTAVDVDVGANIGSHSLYLSNFFSSVWAFEPHPKSYGLLAFNSQDIANINIFNFGLGDSRGLIELNENWANMGSASVQHAWSESPDKVSSKVDRLDDVCAEADDIGLIKIDVEGFELHVLRGAQNTIQKHQPLILIEQLKSEFVDVSTHCIEALLQEGYLFCWHDSWASSHNFISRRFNAFRNLILGGTYDYNFICGKYPPVAKYDMLIAVPRLFQSKLCLR